MTEAQRQLAEDNSGYAFGVLRKFKRKYPHADMVDEDEMNSAVWFALVKAAAADDCSKGYEFGSLLFASVWNALVDVLRVELKWEYRRGAIGDVHVAKSPNPLISLAVHDGRRFVRESVASVVTKHQLRAICLVYFEGLDQMEAASRIGISQSSLSECLDRARDRMRDSPAMRLAWDEYRGAA